MVISSTKLVLVLMALAVTPTRPLTLGLYTLLANTVLKGLAIRIMEESSRFNVAASQFGASRARSSTFLKSPRRP